MNTYFGLALMINILFGAIMMALAFSGLIQAVKDANKLLLTNTTIDKAFRNLWIGLGSTIVTVLSILVSLLLSSTVLVE